MPGAPKTECLVKPEVKYFNRLAPTSLVALSALFYTLIKGLYVLGAGNVTTEEGS
jgi:hypothetical protein